MSMFDNILNKVRDLTQEHPDKVEEFSDQALDRVTEVVNERTGDSHADLIDKGREFLDGRIGE